MLRFRLFGFPIEIHWMFWVITLLIGGSIAARLRLNPGVILLLWTACVTVSILVHELGHTFLQRKFLGARPRILLYGLGGLAIPEGGRRGTRGQSILISLAGPAAGLALGGVVYLISRGYSPPGIEGRLVIAFLLWINVAWSLINLLPVLPLDGGRVMEAVVAGPNWKLPYQIGMVVAIVAAVGLFLTGWTFAPFFFAYLAVTNFQQMRGMGPGFF